MAFVPFEADVLKELREYTRVFLKLDFAYLVAVGAIVTTLKISRGELIEFGANLFFVAIFLAFLGITDTFIDSVVFNDWLSARTGAGKRQSPKFLRAILDLQPLLHMFFVIGLCLGAVSFSYGFQNSRTRVEGRVLLQEAVEWYMKKTGSPPKSLGELQSAIHPLAHERVLAKLDGEGAKVEATGPKSYKITFAGWDKAFGTADDEIVTQDLQLRQVFSNLEN